MALNNIMMEIRTLLENQETTNCLHVDLKRAFNILNYIIQLKTLSLYGSRSIVYDWIITCLFDREQYHKKLSRFHLVNTKTEFLEENS